MSNALSVEAHPGALQGGVASLNSQNSVCNSGCMSYSMKYEQINIYFSKPQKAALEKIAKGKAISVAELVRRIIDKELHRGQKQKG